MYSTLVSDFMSVAVTGVSRLTDAGELTLEAESLPKLLSPTMEQIPEKLTDSKTKREERHLDMLVNKQTTDILRLRASITKHLRDHFHSNQFLEMQTPILADNAGGAIARPFKTRATEFSDKELALRIAPELWLKRLVVGGIDKVFEIGPAFRNEGIDGTHNPEFTTCEFYSAYSNISELIQQTELIMSTMATECQKLISTDLTTLPEINVEKFRGPYKQVEFLPSLEKALGIRFPNLSAEGALPELIAVLKLAGIDLQGETPRSLHKLLDKLGAIYLEPMSFEEPIFITNHPACMSPLAKGFLCTKTYQLVSARAELFVGGRELANMYEEENDPAEQSRKMNAHRRLINKPSGEIALRRENAGDLEEPEEIDEEIPPVDQAFLRSLEYGLPPTGGWGCGVERLVMLFSGTDRISDCLSFGTLRNVVNRNFGQ
jgi:lysyl-tRNA synthetase class 2